MHKDLKVLTIEKVKIQIKEQQKLQFEKKLGKIMQKIFICLNHLRK